MNEKLFAVVVDIADLSPEEANYAVVAENVEINYDGCQQLVVIEGLPKELLLQLKVTINGIGPLVATEHEPKWVKEANK